MAHLWRMTAALDTPKRLALSRLGQGVFVETLLRHRTHWLAWLCIALLGIAGSAQPQPPDTLWTRSYNVSSGGITQSMTATSDGGFLITRCPGYPYDAALLKIDSVGDVQWLQTYEIPETSEMFLDVKPCPAGGYVAVGQRYGFPTYYDPEIYLVRTGDQGDTLWTRTLNVQDDDILNAVEIAANGDIVCAGSAGYIGPNSDTGDVLVVRYTDAGELVWLVRYSTGITCGASDIVRYGDDRFLVGGSSGFMWEDDRSQAYLLMLEGSGDTVWTRTYSSLTFTDCWTVTVIGDGGFAFAGLAKAAPGDVSDLLVLRADSAGQRLWSRRHSPGYARSIHQVADGGLAVFYASSSYPGRGFEYGIQRLTTAGDTLWTGLYGTAGDDYLAAGLVLPDQGYIMLGESPRAYVVRTLPEALSAAEPPPAMPASSLLLSAYPNPFNSVTTIRFALPAASEVELTLYDVAGRVVMARELGRLTAGEHAERVDAEGLASGVYFVRLAAGGQVATRKVALVR